MKPDPYALFDNLETPEPGFFKLSDTLLPDLAHKDTIRIIVLEDEEFHLHIYKIYLQHWASQQTKKNISFMFYLNPAEALKIIPYWKPDIIITDIAMPDMTGEDFIREARDKYVSPDTFAIGMWVCNDLKTIKATLGLGYDVYGIRNHFPKIFPILERVLYGVGKSKND